MGSSGWRPTRLAKQAAALRAAGQTETAEHMEAHLRKVGRCKACGVTLTDPKSLERGIGPDCWAKGHR